MATWRYTHTFSSIFGSETLSPRDVTDGNSGSSSFEQGESLTGLTNSVSSPFIGISVVTVNGVPTTFIAVTEVGGTQWYGAPPAGTTNADMNTAFATLPSVTAGTFTTCFLAGTMIATPEGERAVEDLAIGDLVLTSDGRAVLVKWMGRQTLVTVFGPPENLRPVCIAAGALGEGLPIRDLCVTAGHAMVLDGLLVQAGALVNGTTIRRMTASELGERFIVHHIETEEHEIVLAEGAPTETFVDNVTRRRFDNFAEYEELFGVETGKMDELDHPRVKSARQLPAALRARLDGRAAVLGLTADTAA